MNPDTSRLAQRIASRTADPDRFGAWWIGGSGFIFKTPAAQIWIDPYLSDIVRTMFGIGRAFPAPITVEEAEPDVVVCTHWHEDHLDPGSIPELARRRPSTRFIMPPSAQARALSWGVAKTQVLPLGHGESLELAGVRFTAVFARHEAGVRGWEVPDAMGVVLDFGGRMRVFHTGDTEYDARVRRAVAPTSLALATLCINGSGGNMNAHEAALLAWHLDARALVPHHHYIWAKDRPDPGETLDPQIFQQTYRHLGGTATVIIPEVGRDMTLTAEGLAFA